MVEARVERSAERSRDPRIVEGTMPGQIRRTGLGVDLDGSFAGSAQ
jgi:hypothetical protein